MTAQELREKMDEYCDKYFAAKPFRGSTVSILSAIVDGGADLAALKVKVSGAKTDCAAIKSKVKGLTKTDVLDNFKNGLDDDMRSFVDSHMGGLTDGQKLDVALILQSLKR